MVLGGHRRSRVKAGLDGHRDDGGQLSDAWRVVLLHPHEPPQDVVEVAGPAEHVGVLQPAGDVALSGPREYDGNESKILASVLDEFIL